MPTTIAALLSAIGIAGMDRLVRFNVLAKSGRAVEAAGAGLRFFVMDAIPITGHDVTGRATFRELDQELLAQGVQIVIAGRETELMEWREKTGMDELRPVKVRQFPTLADAVDALQAEL